MKCSDLQFNLSLYADGLLDAADSSAIAGHLVTCPLCRQTYSELRSIRSDLRRICNPEISEVFKNRIKESVRSERHREQGSWMPLSADVREWLQMRVMPYGVGVFASLLIGVSFVMMMFSGMLQPARTDSMAHSTQTSVFIAANNDPFTDRDSLEFISPSDYAKARLAYSSESPSINPQGALVALASSLVRGEMNDDEVVVIADVFGNGLARVAEVVEPSRNSRAVAELEKALQSDPAFAPFVPASMEDRPESVRVVLRFQNVNVPTNIKKNRDRL